MIQTTTTAKCSGDRCTCARAQKLSSGQYRYRISDESLDCDGERILISAWTKLGSYPLHVDHGGDRVGTARVFIREGALIADIEISDPAVRARVDAGELGKASVGFRRLEAERTQSGTIVTTRAELREVSILDAGCNASAHREKSVSVHDVVSGAVRDALRVSPARPTITKSDAVALVKREMRRGFEAAAIEELCSQSGALDGEGLAQKIASSPAVATASSAVLAAAVAAADVAADAVASRL